jgi:hypothetical protein
MKEKTESVSIRLNDRQLSKVRLFARELGLKMPDVIRNMIDNAEVASYPVVATRATKEKSSVQDSTVTHAAFN